MMPNCTRTKARCQSTFPTLESRLRSNANTNGAKEKKNRTSVGRLKSPGMNGCRSSAKVQAIWATLQSANAEATSDQNVRANGWLRRAVRKQERAAVRAAKN